MADHIFKGTWSSIRYFTLPTHNPNQVNDYLFVLDIKPDGTPVPGNCKKKLNAADPGTDLDVEIKSNGNLHWIMITEKAAKYRYYEGHYSQKLSPGLVVVGRYSGQPLLAHKGARPMADGQDDGTWVMTKP